VGKKIKFNKFAPKGNLIEIAIIQEPVFSYGYF